MAGGLVVAVMFGGSVVITVVWMFSFSGVLVYCVVVDQGSVDDDMNS